MAGSFFLVLSFLAFFVPYSLVNKNISLLAGASFYLGALLLANYVILRISGRSFLGITKSSFIVVGLVAATVFEFIVRDLGRLWYFPYWSTESYFFIGYLLGGWIFYILTLTAWYEAGKMILDKLFPGKKRVTKYYRLESTVYGVLGILGAATLIYTLIIGVLHADFFKVFPYAVNVPATPYLHYYYLFAATLGLIFICEFVEYRRHRSSLLKDTLHGYFSPIISVFIGGWILGAMNEIQNLAVYLWRYANYPWPELTVFGAPLVIIAVWPIHIILFIEFWRAFGKEDSKLVFEGDNIR